MDLRPSPPHAGQEEQTGGGGRPSVTKRKRRKSQCDGTVKEKQGIIDPGQGDEAKVPSPSSRKKKNLQLDQVGQKNQGKKLSKKEGDQKTSQASLVSDQGQNAAGGREDPCRKTSQGKISPEITQAAEGIPFTGRKERLGRTFRLYTKCGGEEVTEKTLGEGEHTGKGR